MGGHEQGAGPRVVRFGIFEADLAAGELRRDGKQVRLQGQPYRLLAFLIERPGVIVTREELHAALWPSGTFVDFEYGVNTAVKKVRSALGDSVDNPRFIQTLPRKGYRFIAPVTPVVARSESTELAVPAPSGRRWLFAAMATGVVVILGIVWGRVSARQNTHELHLRQLTDDSGLTTTPAISMDGKLVAYASDRASEGNLDIWVQPLTTGGRAIRVTDHPAQDSDPSFSPDGGQIVFHSEREGGGIYLVPSLGGESRLLARGAFYPRFSPDGEMIAYGSGRNTLVASNVFVVPAAGGTPRRVAADLPWSGEPIWSPDGQSLLVCGMKGIGDRESLDYWVAPVRGGASEKTGLAQFLAENKLSIIQDFEWRGQSLLFAVGSDAFAIDLDPRSRRPRQLRRLATGTSWLGGVRGTLSRFVFSALSYSQHLWMLPLDPATGRVTGQIQPLPHSGGVQIMPASSYDGRLLVYSQLTPSGWELCVRETSSGRDTVLITKHARAKMSPDGTKVAYSLFAPTHAGGEIYLMDSSGGEAQKLLGQMEQPVSIFGWTADGAQLVLYRFSPMRWFTFDLRSHQEKELLFEPQRVIHSVEPSPDFHWAAFNTKGEVNESVFIAPVRSGHSATQSEWITIAKGPGANERPWWSPDGNLLYFLSDKDGHECIWGQRLNSATKHPIGEAFAVYHLHDSRRTPGDQLAGFGPAVTKDRLFFSLSEVSGNVWIAEERN